MDTQACHNTFKGRQQAPGWYTLATGCITVMLTLISMTSAEEGLALQVLVVAALVLPVDLRVGVLVGHPSRWVMS
jgi:hypothetical protein